MKILLIIPAVILLGVLNHFWALFYYDMYLEASLYVEAKYTETKQTMLESFGVVALEQDTTVDMLIDKYSAEYALPIGLMRSLIKVESNFNPDALSSAGAIGLAQIMPANAGRCGVKKYQLYSISENVRCGAQILSENIKHRKSVWYGLAEYNGGTRCINSKGELVCAETREYVPKVLKVWLDIMHNEANPLKHEDR